MKELFKSRTLAGLLGFTFCAISFAQESVTTYEVEDDKRGRAGFYAEPFLTYENNDVSIKTSDLPIIDKDVKSTGDGFGLGARIGAHVGDIFFVAVDGRYSQPQMGSKFYDKAKSEEYNYGLTAGAQTPIAGIRLWATMVLGGRMDPRSGDNGLDLRFEEMEGYRIGAGVYIKNVSVNLEYQNNKFDKTTVQSWGGYGVGSRLNTDTDLEGYTVALGFPMTL